MLNVLAAQILLSGMLRVIYFRAVYFQRLHSPTGRNSHHGVSTVDASLSDIAGNAKRLSQASYDRNDAWLTDSDREELKLIAEPLCIKHHYFIVLIRLMPMKSISLQNICVL